MVVADTYSGEMDGEDLVPDDDLARFEHMYRLHVDAVYAYAVARADPELAEEAVEETFLVAWRRIGSVPDEARPWLCGVARRVVANQRRARRRRGALGDRLVAWRSAEGGAGDPADEVTERAAAVSAFSGLAARDRELLCLTAWCELSADETARVVGCSKPTLLMRLHRARQRFESALALADERARPSAIPVPIPLPNDPRRSLCHDPGI